jgi:hypothetical protein
MSYSILAMQCNNIAGRPPGMLAQSHLGQNSTSLGPLYPLLQIVELESLHAIARRKGTTAQTKESNSKSSQSQPPSTFLGSICSPTTLSAKSRIEMFGVFEILFPLLRKLLLVHAVVGLPPPGLPMCRCHLVLRWVGLSLTVEIRVEIWRYAECKPRSRRLRFRIHNKRRFGLCEYRSKTWKKCWKQR